jgi:prolyl-tRNA synthetase
VAPLVAELHRDAAGIRWPAALAPYHVHICAIRHRDDEVARAAIALHDELRGEGLDVLLDDRDERPGCQFADADLLGAPLRLTLSPRLVVAGEVEWKRRATGETGTVPRRELSALCRT